MKLNVKICLFTIRMAYFRNLHRVKRLYTFYGQFKNWHFP